MQVISIRMVRIAAVATTFLAPLGASAAILDFDALDASAGQPVPLMSFSEDGYSFDLSFTGSSAGPAIFDTTCVGAACNGDTDLIPAMQGENGVGGNVLILQDTSGGIPNDFPGGGTISFTLTSGPSFFLEGFSAIDDGVFEAFDANGLLGSITLMSDNETGRTTFMSSRINVGDTFSFDYSGSGGIDSLVVAPVPVPAALPLVLTGLGALALVRRRRKA